MSVLASESATQGETLAKPNFQTKSQHVEEELREAIALGDLRPGAWVRAEDWAARLQTSLTPVREAMQRLEADGLLRVTPYRGARVAGITRAEFEEVYEIRAALEGLAGSRAVTAINRLGDGGDALRKLLAHLEALQRAMDESIVDGDHVQLRRANKEFHFALYNCSQSPRLIRLIDNFWMTFPWGSLSITPGRPSDAVHEHRQILEFVRRADPEGVRNAITEHVTRSANALLMAEARLGFAVFDEE